MAKKKNNNVTLIVISIITAGIIAIIFANGGITSKNVTKTVSLPLITTKVSSEDNQVHTVSMNLSLSGSQKSIENLENIDQYDLALKAIQSISYEDLRSREGTEIIKEEVLNAVNSNLNNDKIEKVYITGIDLGGVSIPGMVDDIEENSKKSRSEQLQQWFGN